MAVYHPGVRETMHPGLGPWGEAWDLYVRASRLEALLQTPSTRPGSRQAVVFDVGLGAAATALAAIACREGLAARASQVRPLAVVSFENDPAAAHFALAHAGQLGYLAGHEDKLAGLLKDGAWEGDGISWYLRAGDFPKMLQQETRRADAIFFDPFSPRANPEMWSLATMTGLLACRRPGETTRLVTYSSAFSTRSALLLAGFFVGEWPAGPDSRPATEAATEPSALQAPLGPGWLARWRREKNPWPTQTDPRHHRRLREALVAHPQWGQPGALEPDPEPEHAPPPPGHARRRKIFPGAAPAGSRPGAAPPRGPRRTKH